MRSQHSLASLWRKTNVVNLMGLLCFILCTIKETIRFTPDLFNGSLYNELVLGIINGFLFIVIHSFLILWHKMQCISPGVQGKCQRVPLNWHIFIQGLSNSVFFNIAELHDKIPQEIALRIRVILLKAF